MKQGTEKFIYGRLIAAKENVWSFKNSKQMALQLWQQRSAKLSHDFKRCLRASELVIVERNCENIFIVNRRGALLTK